MAQITINEVSQNYTYNIGSNSYATVALPITASWGPAFLDPKTAGADMDDVLDATTWTKFPATQAGLEAFVSTYRGPASNYRIAKDYSYQVAMTLLTSGYDVLVCRLCPGSKASTILNVDTSHYDLTDVAPDDWSDNYTSYFTKSESTFVPVPKGDASAPAWKSDTYYKYIKSEKSGLYVSAKYPGTFGNNLEIELQKRTRRMIDTSELSPYWNLIVRVVDSSGVKTAVENLVFVFDIEHADDTVLQIDEIDSNFITLTAEDGVTDASEFTTSSSLLTDGTDRSDVLSDDTAADMLSEAINYATARYTSVGLTGTDYIAALNSLLSYDSITVEPEDWASSYSSYFIKDSDGKYVPNTSAEFDSGNIYSRSSVVDSSKASTIRYNEWLYTYAMYVYDLLTDKLTYNPERIISPGWDDQNITAINDEVVTRLNELSPLHIKLMDVAYLSRCGTSYIDIPKCLPRSAVYNTSTSTPGYAQMLSRYMTTQELENSLYSTHCALFAPWGQYTYVGTAKQQTASPSFLALMIQRAQILNQSLQYEWALPTNRKHNLKIGKLDYICRKKELDTWQSLEGVGVNIITNIPDLGVGIWGNSTLYEVPPATYQALANLSTRFVVNAVKNTVYKCGVAITFQYNNDQAYNKFYAGVTPLLDTMKNVGAIDDYYVRMAADINGLDQVTANTVIGKIYLVINGVINDIIVDLVALPPGVDLNQYRV